MKITYYKIFFYESDWQISPFIQIVRTFKEVKEQSIKLLCAGYKNISYKKERTRKAFEEIKKGNF